MVNAIRGLLFNRWVLVSALAVGYGSVGLGCGHEHHDDADRAAYHDRTWDHHDYDHHDYDHHDYDRGRY
jgi:hypothetical protein